MENTHFCSADLTTFFPQNFSDFTCGQCGKMFLIKEIQCPQSKLHNPGGVFSLPNFAQAPPSWAGRIWDRKGRVWARFSPWSGAAGQGWTSSFGLEQAVNCPCARNSVLFPSCTLRAEASRDWGEGHTVQDFVLRVRDSADPKREGTSLPSRDSHSQARCPWCCWFVPSLHLCEPSSTHSFSPEGRHKQDIPFLTHRAAKPQTPHPTPFIALVKRNTWRD